MKSMPRALALAIVAAAAVGLGSCGRKLSHVLIPNLPPTVRITAAPIDTSARCDPDPARSCYSLTLHWVGNDPDGRVDHYLYAVDPPSRVGADTVWIPTRGNEERLLFPSRRGIPRTGNETPLARDFHVFAIKAVDNAGASGPLTTRAFFSFTQAPDVYILSPPPSHLLIPILPPSVRITWAGTDVDGVFHDKPVRYKYTLIIDTPSFPLNQIALNPDTLRALYAPDFADWDSTGGDTTTASYTNLVPGQTYMFVVVAFDEAGAYSPIFSLKTNMLRFTVGFAGFLGPKITAFNEYFNYTWNGGRCICPGPFIEVPAGTSVTFNWFAEPTYGADMRSYRWALDIADVDDETPRRNEADVTHWSAKSLNLTSATVGPFGRDCLESEVHYFYIEAEDNTGLRSLAIIKFEVVCPRLTPGATLIVKDTRLLVDYRDRSTGCVARPLSVWPTQAELDTFLFARGGYPWRCYPAGTTTGPGLFAGYSFDTLGTLLRRRDLTIRLSTLGRYQNVIWIVDGSAAVNDDEGDGREPKSSLRYMCEANRFNTLSAYVKQGGRVWVLGGGAGTAATEPWNNGANDEGGPHIYTSLGSRPELVPGRFMWDMAYWRNTMRVSSAQARLTRDPGRYIHGPDPDPTSYTRFLNELPDRIEFKTPATDAMPPNRTNPSDFYQPISDFEWLMRTDNHILENVSPDPEVVHEVSTLDTLYDGSGGRLTPEPGDHYRSVVMTYYHGPAIPQGFLFSGFNIWSFKRGQCQALVDFVMRRMWGLGAHGSTSSLVAVGRDGVNSAVARTRATDPRVDPARPGAIRMRNHESGGPSH